MNAYEERIRKTLNELAIPEAFLERYRLPVQRECENLASIGSDMYNREQRMEPQAASQWQTMAAAARADGVVLLMVSAFRSFEYQRGIIERKLAQGLGLEEITRASALPGYSEHHTGQAIDIGTPGAEPLTEEFEKTAAFEWLKRRGHEFGFSMSYPRDNPFGIMFEPWHWKFHRK